MFVFYVNSRITTGGVFLPSYGQCATRMPQDGKLGRSAYPLGMGKLLYLIVDAEVNHVAREDLTLQPKDKNVSRPRMAKTYIHPALCHVRSEVA